MSSVHVQQLQPEDAGDSDEDATFCRRLNPRTCFPFTWKAFNHQYPSGGAAVLRRVAMWATMLIRVGLSILNVLEFGYGAGIPSFVAGSILFLTNLYFVGGCLAILGKAEGSGTVLGVEWHRLRLDIVLAVLLVLHIFLCLGFLGPDTNRAYVMSAFWVALGLAVIVFGWIAARLRV